MAILGKRNTLTVLKDSRPGLYLDGGELGEILLPGDSIPDGAQVGDAIDVFLYRDSEDRLIATTRIPRAVVGEFAALQVTSVHPAIGAFLDWGLPKDLLLPNREQPHRVYPQDIVVVFIYIDEKSQRIVASARWERHISAEPANYAIGATVSMLVASETPLGYKVIIDNSHMGLLYRSELGTEIKIGETHPGYVRAIRPDGKIDLGLDPEGYQRIGPLAERILDTIRRSGRLSLSDRSTPEEIRAAFQTSKKAFKQALGTLYRQRLIQIETDGITLQEPRPGVKN
ncbi:MAG: S1 RNA-binding domain-containing protein [Terrimicrobiaceae bacterium]